MLKRFFMTALLFAAFAGLSAADPGKLGIAAEQKKDLLNTYFVEIHELPLTREIWETIFGLYNLKSADIFSSV